MICVSYGCIFIAYVYGELFFFASWIFLARTFSIIILFCFALFCFFAFPAFLLFLLLHFSGHVLSSAADDGNRAVAANGDAVASAADEIEYPKYRLSRSCLRGLRCALPRTPRAVG